MSSINFGKRYQCRQCITEEKQFCNIFVSKGENNHECSSCGHHEGVHLSMSVQEFLSTYVPVSESEEGEKRYECRVCISEGEDTCFKFEGVSGTCEYCNHDKKQHIHKPLSYIYRVGK